MLSDSQVSLRHQKWPVLCNSKRMFCWTTAGRGDRVFGGIPSNMAALPPHPSVLWMCHDRWSCWFTLQDVPSPRMTAESVLSERALSQSKSSPALTMRWSLRAQMIDGDAAKLLLSLFCARPNLSFKEKSNLKHRRIGAFSGDAFPFLGPSLLIQTFPKGLLFLDFTLTAKLPHIL